MSQDERKHRWNFKSCCKKRNLPANGPLERSIRSLKAKKSVLSRRCLRVLSPLLSVLRNGQCTYGIIMVILFRMLIIWFSAGTLEDRKGLTALTHSIGCKTRSVAKSIRL